MNSCLYKNTELISVLITNNTNKNVAFSKKQPVCTLQTIKLDTKCTVIQFVADTETESEIVSNIQSKREKIAERENFTPKIGSIGDLPTGRKQFVEDLIQKNRLAFSMGNKDIGKLAYFRFKLPFFDALETFDTSDSCSSRLCLLLSSMFPSSGLLCSRPSSKTPAFALTMLLPRSE